MFNLPNGLQAYYVTNASGFRLDDAPINIVSNPAASDPTVRNGLSCFGCHTEGMKTFEDEVRAVIESNTAPAYDKAQALRLYVAQSEMDALLQEDTDRYRQALEATGGAFGGIEPISRFHEVFQGTVDAVYAAAVVGLEPEAFLEKIRENIGLQNIGLLVLDSDGSMKRDAWTSSFRDILFALDFPELVDKPPVVPQPDRLPGAFVHIPDTNLRAAIAEALGKSPNAPITAEEMERLKRLEAGNKGIQDLTGLQFATNLERLDLYRNQVSNLSPIAGLIQLRELIFANNPISDLSALKGLTNLTYLQFFDTLVSDLSPVTGLINLKLIDIRGGDIGRDLSPLAGLTKLEEIIIGSANLSDLTPLAGLTGLRKLHLWNNDISDLSPLAGLTELRNLHLRGNNISDLSPLAGLTNLRWLVIHNNRISDISPLDGIRENMTVFVWDDNPGFPKVGPTIEGPWLWVVLTDTGPSRSKDLLLEASGGTVTETEIATHGAIEGQVVGDDVWTSRKLPPTGNNIEQMLKGRVDGAMLYGTVSLHSPREQETTLYVGSHVEFKVWLNGGLIYESLHYHASDGYTDFLPVTLKQGRNVLLVTVRAEHNAFFGFEPGTEYTVLTPGVSYAFSKTPIHIGDTFTLDIGARDVFGLAGWQFDIAFDPTALEAIDVSEGNFLKTGGTTFFQGGSIDNAAGKITGLSAARLSTQGVSGTGTLLQVRFKAKSAGETELALRKFQLGSVTGDSIPAGPHEIRIVVKEGLATGDVNRDGQVSILDLILVAQQLGKRVSAGSPVDVNHDGIVSILDLIRVAQGIAESPAAPLALNLPTSRDSRNGTDLIGAVGTESVDATTIEAWIAQARLEDDGSLAFKQGIENLENLLASLIPEETALLANYPNPFNPETWIPYQLAESAEVTLTIYDMNGRLVRRLAVGHQGAGMYQSRSRAVYWDGRNQLGESVASGLYFYTLIAGEFSGTRRMLILK